MKPLNTVEVKKAGATLTVTTGAPSHNVDAFARLRNATVSLVIFIHPHITTWLSPDGFSYKLIFAHFGGKNRGAKSGIIKGDMNNGDFT